MLNTSPDELKSHLDAGGAVFLKLWKPGCGACKLSEPAIERLEKQFEAAKFVQIDAEAHPEILSISESEVLPSFFMFKDGKMLGNVIGFKGIAKLKDLLES